jgi:hypothetical protein
MKDKNKTRERGSGAGRHPDGSPNAAAIARECGLSRQRVSILLREGHSPGAILRRQKRKADAAANLSADGHGIGMRPRKSESLLRSRGRKEAALASLRELELRQKQGELVERDQVLAELASAIVWVRDSFLFLPSRLRDQCDRQTGAVVEALFDGEIRQVLAGFAHKLNMGEADIERGWALWTEFLEWVRREKKGAVNGHG